MSGDAFQRRVALLRESWAERRQLKNLAGTHDFDSQLALLHMLYRWAEAAVGDIQAVYGSELSITLSPAPSGHGPATGFAATIADNYTVTFALDERQRAGTTHWHVTVTVGSGGALVGAGPERRTGQWTRARVEDIFLSILGAHERAVSEGTRAGLSGLRARGA